MFALTNLMPLESGSLDREPVPVKFENNNKLF